MTVENYPPNLSFPYPKQQAVARPEGEGCQVCVHRTYCPALYWFTRYIDYKPDVAPGIMCASWSNNMSDQVRIYTADDTTENQRRCDENVLTEANRCGMTDLTTGDAHDPW